MSLDANVVDCQERMRMLQDARQSSRQHGGVTAVLGGDPAEFLLQLGEGCLPNVVEAAYQYKGLIAIPDRHLLNSQDTGH